MSRDDEPSAPNPYQPPESEDQNLPAETSGDASLGEVGDRFMRLLSQKGSQLLGVWAPIAGFYLLMMGVSAFGQFLSGDAAMMSEAFENPEAAAAMGQEQSLGGMLVSLLIYPLLAIYMALYFGGYRIMRNLELGSGQRARSGIGEMFHNFLPLIGVIVVYGLATFIGTMCCVLPGLVVAFIFYPAPYLVSSLDYGVFESLSASFNWVKRHWVLILVVSLLGIAIAVVMVLTSMFGAVVFVESMGEAGIFASSFLIWVIATILGYFVWIFGGSVLITIEEYEATKWQ